MNGKSYSPSKAHKDYIEKLISPGDGVLFDETLKKFKLHPDSCDIPLIRDGLSSMATLQMYALTPYDDIKVTRLPSNGIISFIRDEYDVLWELLRNALDW
ncbi:hypothetical protein M1146_07565 [Patescibacteria group bacterium]|nr:hypothetical protein [Patescibacteria group bacterium]